MQAVDHLGQIYQIWRFRRRAFTVLNKTKEEETSTKIDAFYNKEGMNFNKLMGSIANGAPAMLGKHSGFKAKLQVTSHTFMIHA